MTERIVGGWKDPPLVTVVTPVLNGEGLIEATISSVLEQTAVRSGRVILDYVVADGGSRDGTVQFARRVGGDRLTVRSSPDAGMYDALADVWGDALADGTRPPQVMAYLNAGDLWDPNALDVVLDVMIETGARWVCGMHVLHNQAGQITHAWLPSRFRPRLIQAGVYGGLVPHLQQESTFWTGELMRHVDLDRLRGFRLAGDQFLWASFAEYEEPVIVEAVLGGHRVHQHQLSHDVEGYRREVLEATRPANVVDRLLAAFELLAWNLPPGAKKRLNPRHLVRYDYRGRRWC